MPIYFKNHTVSTADAPPEGLRRRLRSRLGEMALATKMMFIGGVFLVLTLSSIGLTLWVTWQLEGGAAAVNEAGRMRMRSFQMALSLQEAPAASPQLSAVLTAQLKEFDASVALLRRGDSSRPLAVPWDARTRMQFEGVVKQWQSLRVQALDIANGSSEPETLHPHVNAFVAQVDLFVSAIEQHLSSWTTMLHSVQLAMMALSILSALALIYAGYVFILEPVSRLQAALHDIEEGDFATRVVVEADDEMGSLADGFNSMAENLQSLYGNLESKVREKTTILETKQQRLTALYEVAAFVASAETLEDLAHGFASRMRRIAQADAVAIRWSDVANERYVLLGSDCLPQVMAEEEQCVLAGDCLCGAKFETDTMPSLRVIPILDATRNLANQTMGRQIQKHCERAGYTTLITVPLGLHMRVLGEVELFYRGEPELSDEEKALFEALASHLAGAMESLRAAALGREAAVASERQLLAQELHDSIAQSLAFLKIQMQLLRDAMAHHDQPAIDMAMGELDVGVRESYNDVRELLLHFRVRTRSDDIEPALRESLSKLEHQSKLRTHLNVQGQGLPVPPDVQIQVLHIVQEALSNTRKHAQASQVWVEVQTQPSWCVSVRDDGCGFDVQAGPPNSTHVGLSIMRERAERIGAELSCESGPGGTRIELRLPNMVAGRSASAITQPAPLT